MENLKYCDHQVCFRIDELISHENCDQLVNFINNKVNLECEDTDILYKSYNYCHMRWNNLPNNFQKLSSIIFEKIKKIENFSKNSEKNHART